MAVLEWPKSQKLATIIVPPGWGSISLWAGEQYRGMEMGIQLVRVATPCPSKDSLANGMHGQTESLRIQSKTRTAQSKKGLSASGLGFRVRT